MSDLFWPGDERAGNLFTGRAFAEAMVSIEAAWLGGLTSAGIAPASVLDELKIHLDEADLELIATDAEATGNPVVPLVRLLRERVTSQNAEAAQWLHRGLTSQDVVDTALVLCCRDTLDRLLSDLGDQVTPLRAMVQQHRSTLMAGRTLTQFAVPTTFGLKAATWLHGTLDAAQDVVRLRSSLPGQFGGAAGTMAATCDLAVRAGLPEPAKRAAQVVSETSRLLRLADSPPWHTSRAPITRLGDALAGCTDAWGRIANDVITLSRPEIAELTEPAGEGRGASSTMPQKRNPVLSMLIRRAALGSPMLAAQLHTAAADSGDERPAGTWHVEWAALATLARHTLTASSQMTEVLSGLHVGTARMKATLDAARPAILAERLVPWLAGLPADGGQPLGEARAREFVLTAGSADEFRRAVEGFVPEDVLTGLLDPGQYLGATELIIEAALARAGQLFPEETS